VLVEQSALPLPSVPLFLAAGALIQAGRLNGLLAVACAVAASLIADAVWFQLGRRRGRRILNLLCRLSLEPDSCVRMTENVFLKYGMNSLLISKFVPGLNAVAAPLAGNSKSPFARFLLYDAAGAALWCASYMALGYLFSTQLELLLGYASTMGSGLLLLVAALFAVWIGQKWVQRHLFLKRLRGNRISAAELRERLKAGEELVIVDLRSRLAEESPLIPGAIRVPAEELVARSREIPRDREIILFCS
jgi:membrane protein DedA with SNARE-associated domain